MSEGPRDIRVREVDMPAIGEHEVLIEALVRPNL
jgi:NADPH:quinone reductase-like Zn-dependent oxidoreductase